MSLPALVLVLTVALTAVMAVRDQIACLDAAREAARTAARGEPAVSRADGAAVTITMEGDTVRATATIHRNPLGSGLPGYDVSATSVAAVEPS